MRVKDENKKIAIYKAAMEIINSNGLENTSMSKIARTAGVSSSTIYVYFKNKEDMLNKLYLMAKVESSEAALKEFSEDLPVKEGFKLFFINFYHYMVENPVQFSFTEQFYNSPCISQETKDEGMSYYQPILNLIERGIKEKLFQDFSFELITAFIHSPLMYLIKQHNAGNMVLSEDMVQQLINMVWNGLTR